MVDEPKVKLRALRLISKSLKNTDDLALEERFYAPGVVFEMDEADAKRLLKKRNRVWDEKKRKWDESPVVEKAGSAKISSEEDRVKLYIAHVRNLKEETRKKVEEDIARNQ